VAGTLMAGAVGLKAQEPFLPISEPPYIPTAQTEWRSLMVSIAAHGAASGFDAWTSWQRPERNSLLASNGRFDASSAYRKAGIFAGASLIEVLVVYKWGKKHPWLARACRIANFTSAAMLASAGIHNLSNRR